MDSISQRQSIGGAAGKVKQGDWSEVETDPLHQSILRMLLYRGHPVVKYQRLTPYHNVFHALPPNASRSEDAVSKDVESLRPDAHALVMLYSNPAYSGAEVKTAMRLLYDKSVDLHIHPSSSIIFVYIFPRKRNALEKSYVSVLVDRGLTLQQGFYLEEFHASYFNVDHSVPRSTRGWKLRAESYFDMMPVLAGGDVGKVITIDKPPTMANTANEIKYVGGRPNDYVTYERLERLEVGPMWSLAMRKIVHASSQSIAAADLSGRDDGGRDEADDMEAETGLEAPPAGR